MEAAQRPTMRFVEPKTQEQQSRAIVFRSREQLVNQPTELVNALRAYLYEFGYVAPQGIGHLSRLEGVIEDKDAELPDLVRDLCRDLLDQIGGLTSRIDVLKKRIDALSRQAATFAGCSLLVPWPWCDGPPGGGALQDSWLGRMLGKKPRILVAIALANKMARGSGRC